MATIEAATPPFADALWIETLTQFAVAHHREVMHRDHLVRTLVPLYLGRAAAFLAENAAWADGGGGGEAGGARSRVRDEQAALRPTLERRGRELSHGRHVPGILRETWTNYASAARAFLPRILATLSIVLVGWLLALVPRLPDPQGAGLDPPGAALRAHGHRRASQEGRPPAREPAHRVRSCSGSSSWASCSPGSTPWASSGVGGALLGLRPLHPPADRGRPRPDRRAPRRQLRLARLPAGGRERQPCRGPSPRRAACAS